MSTSVNRTISRVLSVIGKIISSRALCEPATNTPLPFLTISSHLTWIIRVYASNNSFVTVEDPKELRVSHEKVDALHATSFLLVVADAALPSLISGNLECVEFRKCGVGA